MAEHQNTKSKDTQIIVRECNPIKSGRGKTGEQWTMFQLIATKPDGTPIPLNLRSFDEVPVHEVVDVNVTPFVSQEYGTSYTVKMKAPSKSQLQMEELKGRVEIIERHLGIQVGGPPRTPAPPPAGPVQTPPPPPVQQLDGSSATGDVPF